MSDSLSENHLKNIIINYYSIIQFIIIQFLLTESAVNWTRNLEIALNTLNTYGLHMALSDYIAKYATSKYIYMACHTKTTNFFLQIISLEQTVWKS